jgi:hypothetical protein
MVCSAAQCFKDLKREDKGLLCLVRQVPETGSNPTTIVDLSTELAEFLDVLDSKNMGFRLLVPLTNKLSCCQALNLHTRGCIACMS